MSTEEKYNGWTNRETWAVALHINNDQGWQESIHDKLTEGTLSNGIPLTTAIQAEDVKHLAAWAAGEVIRENVEEMLGADAPEGIYDPAWFTTNMLPIIHDIGSLWRVDWREIGAAFLSDLEEDTVSSS